MNKKTLSAFAVVILAPIIVLAATFEDGSYFRVNGGTTKYIYTAQETDIGITNTSSKDILVLNNSPSEIIAFISNKSAQVEVCNRQDGTWTPDSTWSAEQEFAELESNIKTFLVLVSVAEEAARE